MNAQARGANDGNGVSSTSINSDGLRRNLRSILIGDVEDCFDEERFLFYVVSLAIRAHRRNVGFPVAIPTARLPAAATGVIR